MPPSGWRLITAGQVCSRHLHRDDSWNRRWKRAAGSHWHATRTQALPGRRRKMAAASRPPQSCRLAGARAGHKLRRRENHSAREMHHARAGHHLRQKALIAVRGPEGVGASSHPVVQPHVLPHVEAQAALIRTSLDQSLCRCNALALRKHDDRGVPEDRDDARPQIQTITLHTRQKPKPVLWIGVFICHNNKKTRPQSARPGGRGIFLHPAT
jgi:hypothetical protein